MQTIFNLARIILSVLICSIMLSACGPTVSMQVEVPPDNLRQPISSICISSFSGKHGALLVSKIKSRIYKENYITLRQSAADATLKGTLSIGRIEKDSYSKSYVSKDGKRHTTYNALKKASGMVTYTLMKGNKVLASGDHSYDYIDSSSGSSSSEARSGLDTDTQVIGSISSNLAIMVMKDITPHQETWKFTLQGAGIGSYYEGNDFLKAGVDYYQAGRFNQAEEFWQRVIDSSAQPEERAAAHYNMGVSYTRQKLYKDAYHMFQEADSTQPANSVYMEAMTLVERASLSDRSLTRKWRPGKKQTSSTNRNLKKYKLTINPTPVDCKIRIMNIGPVYKPQILLTPGQYDILVEKQGYSPHRKWVTLKGSDMILDVELEN